MLNPILFTENIVGDLLSWKLLDGQFGDRFLPWRLTGDVAQSWEERRRHAENIRAIRSRFAPQPAVTVAAPSTPATPPAVDLLGQPIPTDLFGNDLPPLGRKRK